MQAVVADAVRNIQPRGLPPLATAAAASALRQRYVNVSLDSMYGGPSICAMLPQSTPSSLNRAYVLALLEGAIGDKVTSSDVIVEFGGGSGFLAASLFAADPDFTGLYVIWDLPLMGALQRHVLEQHGVTVYSGIEEVLAARKGTQKGQRSQRESGAGVGTGARDGVRGVVLLSDADAVESLLHAYCQQAEGADGTVATGGGGGCQRRTLLGIWSLSEVALSIRAEVLRVAAGFEVTAVAYQREFVDLEAGTSHSKGVCVRGRGSRLVLLSFHSSDRLLRSCSSHMSHSPQRKGPCSVEQLAPRAASTTGPSSAVRFAARSNKGTARVYLATAW